MSSTWSIEVESQATAPTLFKAFILDWHNLGPKLLPDLITSVTVVSGDGSPGSVRQISFSPAIPYGFVKERLDFIDHEKFELKQTLVEGGDLGKKLESLTSHFKIEPKGSGSVVKYGGNYTAIPGVDVSEDIKKSTEGIVGSIKAVEGYLLANPSAYA